MTHVRSALLSLILLFALTALGCGGDKSNPRTDGDEDSPSDQSETDGDLDGEGDAIPEEEPDAPDGDKEEGPEEEGEAPPDVSEQITRGVFWLENGETVLANQAFQEAFDIDPMNPNARFGLALTESMIGIDTIEMLLQAGMDAFHLVDKKSGGTPAPGDVGGWNAWLDSAVFDILDLIGGHFNRSVELYAPLKEMHGLSLTFTRMPVYLGITETTWLTGEIDDADVPVFDSMARLLSIVFNYIKAHSMKGDLATAVSHYQSGRFGDLNVDLALRLVAYLVNTDEAFMSFRPTGLQEVKATKDLMIEGLRDPLLASDRTAEEAETDANQEDEVFSIITKKGEKHLCLNIWRHDSKSDEDVLDHVSILTPDTAVAIADLIEKINTPGDPAPVADLVMPAVASALMLPIGFGLLDQLGLDLPGTNSTMTPETLITLVNGIIRTDVLALDFGTFYQNPPPLRAMLPAVTNDSPDPWGNKLTLEWECPAELIDDGAPDGSGGLLCGGENDTLVDSDHFVESTQPIEADGITPKTPYILMNDPSFGGLLFVDMEALNMPNSSMTPRWQEADQRSFNAALGVALKNILNLLK